jgi:hypothetical protein
VLRSVAVVALAACLATPAVALTPATRAAPARCSDAAARRLVERFAADFSAGRLRATDALWARGPAFAWYSTSAPGARVGARATDRSTLRAYFRSRIAAGEKLRVVSMQTTADPRRGLRHFHGTVSRRARGMRATRYAFKGAADCRTRRLGVWSMSAA